MFGPCMKEVRKRVLRNYKKKEKENTRPRKGKEFMEGKIKNN